MEIKILNSSDAESVKELFVAKKYMGIDEDSHRLYPDVEFKELAYDVFCETFLSGLKTYKAFGSIENGKITSYISFHESADSPEWYWTHMRSNSSNRVLPKVLDKVIEYNESNGRLKFFSMFNSKYSAVMRRLTFSDYNSERYGFFDEFIVPTKTRCIYTTHWHELFTRTLLPVDALVRCSFLKQEYRTNIPIGGFL